MTQNNRQCVYIDSEGPEEQSVEKALAWLLELGQQDSEKQNALLAVNTKKQLKGVLSSVIGEGPANELSKKNPVRLDDVEIRMMTKRIDPQGWHGGPVLALFPDRKLLNKIDDMYDVTDVLVVPWNREEVEFWIDTWEASELSGASQGSTPEISDPVVEEAVESLNMLVNTSTGIRHQLDRSKCIEIFETLHSEGYDLDPGTIRAWLVSEKDWSTDHADDVKEVIEGVNQGKSFQYDRGGLADDIIKQWEEKAKDD